MFQSFNYPIISVCRSISISIDVTLRYNRCCLHAPTDTTYCIHSAPHSTQHRTHQPPSWLSSFHLGYLPLFLPPLSKTNIVIRESNAVCFYEGGKCKRWKGALKVHCGRNVDMWVDRRCIYGWIHGWIYGGWMVDKWWMAEGKGGRGRWWCWGIRRKYVMKRKWNGGGMMTGIKSTYKQCK